MSHRLFVGIRPPAAIRDALIDLMEGIDHARWQDEDQLHLTLRFIGEVDRHQADELADRLQMAKGPQPDIAIGGVGTFAKNGRVHTLWAGIDPTPELIGLQRRIERICVAAGLEPEHRKYHPHVTLARLNRASGPLDSFLLQHQGLRLGPWRAEAYILYEATLRPDGSIYEPVVRYSLEPGT